MIQDAGKKKQSELTDKAWANLITRADEAFQNAVRLSNYDSGARYAQIGIGLTFLATEVRLAEEATFWKRASWNANASGS